MPIQGMNLPSIAGVLGFRDYTDQLNNANAGMRNLVGLANDWAKAAYQQSNENKRAEEDREFKEEQDAINRAFQDKQQQKKFDHELGMFKKQQEQQRANEKMKFNQGLQESMTTPISDKVDTNAMTEQRLRNKVIEMKQHPEWFSSEEEYQTAIADTNKRADEVKRVNEDLKLTNKLQNEFKEMDKDNFRNADDLLYWYSDNKDEIDRLDPSIEAKVYNAVARKQAEQKDWNREQRGKKRGETRDALSTNKALKEQSAADFVSSLH